MSVRTTGGVAAAVLVRATTLVQLLAATLLLPAEEHRLVAIALGVGAAAQLFTDSGAAAHLAVVDGSRGSVARLVPQLLALQVVAAALATLGGGLLVLRAAEGLGAGALVGLVAVPATSAVESVGRLGRVLWLRVGDARRHAQVDAAYAGARAVTVVALLLGWGVPAFAWGLALALVVTLRTWVAVTRGVGLRLVPATGGPVRPSDLLATVRHSLGYGLPVVAAGLYSQAPVVVTSATSSVETAAAVAVAARLVQPLEVVAATHTQIVLPDLAREPGRPRRLLMTMLVLGLAVTLLGAVGATLFLAVTDAPAPVWVLTFLLLAVLPVKHVNYGLATLLMAWRRPGARTAVAVGLGTACVIAVVAVADGPVLGIGVVVVVCEVLLLAGLASVAARLAPRPVEREAVELDG